VKLSIVAIFLIPALTLSRVKAADIDPIEELNAVRLERAQGAPITSESLADIVFSRPGWRERIAKYIANSVEKSRISDDDLQAYYRTKAAVGVQPFARQFPDAKDPYLEDKGSSKRVERATSERERLMTTLELLQGLKDQRVVPMVAPLLSENEESISYGDYRIHSTQHFATEIMKGLSREGVIERSIAGSIQPTYVPSYDLNSLRKWWRENREKFDPVPEPLRAIDAGTGVIERSKTVVPLASSTPPLLPPS
jgi:hypothetical protein